MSDEETFEENFQFFFSEYFAEGRDKKQLIRMLRGWPEASPLIIEEIIQHLENPNKRYLGKRSDFNVERRNAEILSMFEHGPLGEFPLVDTSKYPEHPATGWQDKSYDEKIAEIAKKYPNIKISYLYKLISLLQNQ